MKILVTGGSGFIGRNIIESYSSCHTILAPTHGQLDLTDEEAVRAFLRSHAVDVVIHSAVKPGHRNARDQANQLYSNTRMFFNLIRNSDRFRKMIFIGSGAVYDMRHYAPRMDEAYFDSHVPADEHGFSKYIIAKHIERLDNVQELRVFGVFGRYEDYAIRFISNAICKTLFDLPITIRQNRRFDYLYIDDLIPVLDYFIAYQGRHAVYNVTPDTTVDLWSIADLVISRSGKKLPILVAEPGMGAEYSGDNSRLRAEIPGLTFTPLAAAIDRLYTWYADNINSIDRNCLLVDK